MTPVIYDSVANSVSYNGHTVFIEGMSADARQTALVQGLSVRLIDARALLTHENMVALVTQLNTGGPWKLIKKGPHPEIVTGQVR